MVVVWDKSATGTQLFCRGIKDLTVSNVSHHSRLGVPTSRFLLYVRSRRESLSEHHPDAGRDVGERFM